jgi:hypothetical protein
VKINADELLGKLREVLYAEENISADMLIDFMNWFEDLDDHIVQGGNLPSDWLEAQFYGLAEDGGSPDTTLN